MAFLFARIDTFVMGDDWKGKFDFLKDQCEVVYLDRTPEISTTQIKHDIGAGATEKMDKPEGMGFSK